MIIVTANVGLLRFEAGKTGSPYHRQDGVTFAEVDLSATLARSCAAGGGIVVIGNENAWSDDTCPKSLFEEIMRLCDQP
jgi:hypothetical protein